MSQVHPAVAFWRDLFINERTRGYMSLHSLTEERASELARNDGNSRLAQAVVSGALDDPMPPGRWMPTDEVDAKARVLDELLNGAPMSPRFVTLDDVVAQLRTEAQRRGSHLLHTPPASLAADRLPHALTGALTKTGRVLDEVAAERRRQDGKWGEQNHPDFTIDGVAWPSADYAKSVCEKKADYISFADILFEEVAEAAEEAESGKTAALREELVQVAAVAVAWIEAIDRRENGNG